ncbi:MAG: PAS domain-containing protein [Candidatus Muiribacteriota bacterium]
MDKIKNIRLGSILKKLADIVLVAGNDFVIKYLNERGEKFFNIKVNSENKSYKCHKVVWGNFLDSTICPIEKAIKTKKEVVIERGTKRGYFFLIRAIPILNKNNNVDDVLLLMDDITGKKHFEIFMEKAQKRNNIIIDSLRGAFWEWDINNSEFVDFSPRWYESLGYEPYELPPENITWFQVVHPDDMKFIIDEVYSIIKGEKTKIKFKMRLKSKRGEYKTFYCFGKYFEDKELGKKTIIGINIEVSELDF